MNAVSRNPLPVRRHPSPPASLGIADKNPFLASELASFLESSGPFKVAIRTSDACALARAAADGLIDIAIVGWEMPHGTSANCVKDMKARGVKVIVYTGCSRPDVPYRALSLGAAGFCSKADAPDKLMETIVAVRSGMLSFPYIDLSALNQDPLWSLTHRERQVLEAVAQGSTNVEIANALDISPNTVKFHLRRLYEKIGVLNRGQAAAYFFNNGFGR